MEIIDPAKIAAKYLEESRSSVEQLGAVPKVVGFIASEDKPSLAYANTTRRVFTEAGFEYELRPIARLALESAIQEANEDASVHGIFIYFPVFHGQEDNYLRNLVDYRKDVEAGSLYWTRKLSANDRLATKGDSGKKALLPCTPLAIVKLLDDSGHYGTKFDKKKLLEAGEQPKPLAGKFVTIFNRSEVIGRPLGVMMSNDGAVVTSIDENGALQFINGLPQETDMTRAQALAKADYIVTGVPNERFERVKKSEIRSESVCVNFSSIENFEPDVAQYVRTFVPRVGPMTVAMCMRNTVRLYQNFHQGNHQQ